MGGQVSFMLCSVTTCAPRAGTARLALAITGLSRSALAPAVPTVAEALPGTEINTGFSSRQPRDTGPRW
ncbi:MAG: hypothetical protein IPO58_26620 [Betaproteobacteria bacterium]|nr:hypothetical protein [Betaproteobacteria bacterium]